MRGVTGSSVLRTLHTIALHPTWRRPRTEICIRWTAPMMISVSIHASHLSKERHDL
jgi:hypothetical protein